MRSIIAFDLETTGLDPRRDAIIEVGAVRFKGDRVEAEWSSLISAEDSEGFRFAAIPISCNRDVLKIRKTSNGVKNVIPSFESNSEMFCSTVLACLTP